MKKLLYLLIPLILSSCGEEDLFDYSDITEEQAHELIIGTWVFVNKDWTEFDYNELPKRFYIFDIDGTYKTYALPCQFTSNDIPIFDYEGNYLIKEGGFSYFTQDEYKQYKPTNIYLVGLYSYENPIRFINKNKLMIGGGYYIRGPLPDIY